MVLDKYDPEESQVKGNAWLGSMPVQGAGDAEERRHLYLPKDATPEGLEPVLAAIRRAHTPLPDDRIIEGLARISVLCRAKAMDEDEQTLQLSAFLEKLREYPADAVKFALDEWPEINQWHPSWKELKRLITAHCWSRMQIRDALIARLQKRCLSD